MAQFLLMAMSLRKDSLNKKLIGNAYRLLTSEKSQHQFESLEFNDFPMPIYDGDVEATSGVPEGAKRLAQKISAAQALILATPEYNGGIAGPFKNAIDWVSRISPMPWHGKNVLLLGASPGSLGAIRGLAHSRVPLESLGVFVFPEMFGLPQAHQAFDEAGKMKDQAVEERLRKLLFKFRDHVKSGL